MIRAALLVMLAGCWVQPAQPVANRPAPVVNQPSPPPPGATVNKSEWQGQYQCAQGPTALDLKIEQRCVASGCEVSAIFEFGPLPANPSVPHGSYRMRGDVTQNEHDEAVLVLKPEQWIEQPANYMMVGLTATSDVGQQNMQGHIDNQSCGEVSLQRVQ